MAKQIFVLVSIIVALAVLLFVARYYRAQLPKIPVQERPNYIPIAKILPVHEQRIKDCIELLRGQSLDETFVYLLDDQQYHYPGYHPPAEEPVHIETTISTRSFLKVFQQFDALSREQAIEELNVFCQRAIKDFDAALEAAMLRYEVPASAPSSFESVSITGAKYSICTTLFLAVRAGEYQLLINQLDEMQHIVDACVDRVNRNDVFPAPLKQIIPYMISLDDDCILTILMYALERAGKDTSIPFEGNFVRKTIPLCRWDATLTHYDFEVIRRLKEPDSKDVVEQFDVYEFPRELFFNDPDGQKKKLIINTLKERLSM